MEDVIKPGAAASRQKEVVLQTLFCRLRDELGETVYARWFEGQIEMEWLPEASTLRVGSSEQFVLNWHQGHFAAATARVAAEVFHCSKIQVQYVESGISGQECSPVIPGFSEALLDSRAQAKKPASSRKKGVPIVPEAVKSASLSLLEERWNVFFQHVEARYAEGSLPRLGGELPEVSKSKKKKTQEPKQPETVVLPSALPVVKKVRREYGSFESFVVGDSNQLAYTTAQSIVLKPGVCSPVVFHGGSGVGKTHLLQAIRESLRAANMSVLYCTGQDFVSEYIGCIQDRDNSPARLAEFRKAYRQCDVLLVDDLQGLLNKPGTVAEFFNILCERNRYSRQVVLSCDRTLDQLTSFGEGMCSLLKGGYWCFIAPQGIDVRLNLVAQLMRENQMDVNEKFVRFVAERTSGDAREIKGFVDTFQLFAGDGRIDLQNLDFPIENSDNKQNLVVQLLTNLSRPGVRAVTLDDIKQVVAAQFGLELGLLTSGGRARRVSQPRMLAMWLARKYTRKPLADIGQAFGCTSHSTVISAQKKVETWCSDQISIQMGDRILPVAEAIQTLEARINNA